MTTDVISEVRSKSPKDIDREKVCPFLLRIFISPDRHHTGMEFAKGKTPNNELQVYTWLNCSLKELMGLIKDVSSETNVKGTTFDFVAVSPERSTPRMALRNIGSVVYGHAGVDDRKTLGDLRFEPGDYIDVSVVGPRQANDFRRASGGGRRFRSDRY